jgi:hypothetical protein
MAEWLKARASKACIRETVSGVRIPLSPPTIDNNARIRNCRLERRSRVVHVRHLWNADHAWYTSDTSHVIASSFARAAMLHVRSHVGVLTHRFDVCRASPVPVDDYSAAIGGGRRT